MALKEREITIEAEGRDKGKRFLIIEMPAAKLEKWGLRALMAIATSGITVPQEMADAGIIGVALIGYQAFMGADFAAIEPLMDEMMACVQYAPLNVQPIAYNPQFIDEVSTFRKLREEWLELHTGFSLAALALQLREATAAKIAAQQSISSNTSTSRES